MRILNPAGEFAVDASLLWQDVLLWINLIG